MLFNRHHYAGYPAMSDKFDAMEAMARLRRQEAAKKVKGARPVSKRKPTTKQLTKSKTLVFNAVMIGIGAASIVGKGLGLEMDLERFSTMFKALDVLLSPDALLTIAAVVTPPVNYMLRYWTKKPLNEK